MNPPIDILAVASLANHNAENRFHAAMCMNNSPTASMIYDEARAAMAVTSADLLRVQSLILELATEG